MGEENNLSNGEELNQELNEEKLNNSLKYLEEKLVY